MFAFVAASGVVLAAYYALRLYQRTMHGRKPERVESRDLGLRDGLVLAPLVACIVALAFYPQLILQRTDDSADGGGGRRERSDTRLGLGAPRTAMTFNAPDIDYAGLSPIIALTAGICVVLLAGVFDRLKSAVPLLTLTTLGAAAGLFIWQWGERKDLVAGALRLDELAVAVALIAIFAAAVTVLLSIREPAVEQARERRVPHPAARLGARDGACWPRPRT